MGCTLDHRPGHTISLRRGPARAPRLGVGIGCLRLGDGAARIRDAGQWWGGASLLHPLQGESHCRLETHPAVRTGAVRTEETRLTACPVSGSTLSTTVDCSGGI